MSIHPTAIVESGAELGADVTIGPFSIISDKVQIGDNTVIGPHVFIHPRTSIGSGCSIHACAVLGDVPQDVAFKETESYVRIGSNCIIREGVTIHRGTKPETTTQVGDHCFLMGYSHFAHNVRLGDHVIVVNGALVAGYVEVGDRAFISGNCVIHQFVKIGRMAMVGGGCAIGKDVPPFCTTLPGAMNTVTCLNVVGMRRAGIGNADRLAIKRAFDVLYRSGLNFSDAVARIRQEHTSGPALEFCEFVEASERGICKLR
ncbi:acyl-ACP--UDP-N-acetylglucosamine O-acyltransferase [Verrucomicrobiota bacterium]